MPLLMPLAMQALRAACCCRCLLMLLCRFSPRHAVTPLAPTPDVTIFIMLRLIRRRSPLLRQYDYLPRHADDAATCRDALAIFRHILRCDGAMMIRFAAMPPMIRYDAALLPRDDAMRRAATMPLFTHYFTLRAAPSMLPPMLILRCCAMRAAAC